MSNNQNFDQTKINQIKALFKAYDLRGSTKQEYDSYPLNEEIYYWVGRGFVEVILKPENSPLAVNLVRDGRLTSPLFASSLKKGLEDAGAVVYDLGLGTTDLMYASCINNGFAGMMVTASHNPKDDNGLKIVKNPPQMLGLKDGLDKIRDFVLAGLMQ